MLRRTFVSLLAAPFGLASPDDDGMLVIDGKRQFVLGLYALPKSPHAWEQARAAGFNLLRVRASSDDFALARKHGLRAWVSVGSISAAKRASDQARIRQVVEQFRNDPALLFWETEDEPAFVWKSRKARIPPEQIIETHDFVKALDPVHPLYLNHAPTNLESTLRKYNPGAEILATDIYPVIPHGIREQYALWPDGQQGDLLDTSISQVGLYAEKMRRVAGPSRAVFMVLQAFAWEDLRKQGKDPKMVLYPNRNQLRSMIFQSIVHGANGILFWGLPNVPPQAPLWDDLRSVTNAMKPWIQALSGRRVKLPLRLEYRDTGHSLDRGIEWSAHPLPDGVLLLCVNADRNPIEVSLEATGFSNGVMEQSFAPFEAKALHLV